MRSDTNAAGEGARFDYEKLIAEKTGAVKSHYEKGQIVYAQGDPAESLFYIVSGVVKISVLSEQGREAIIAFLGPTDFIGEGCMDGRPLRNSTITATTASEIVRMERTLVIRLLGEDQRFAAVFMAFLLGRNEKLKSDLIDQMFNSSEKRLARILLTLANSEFDPKSSLIPLPITQEVLANMVGTTRSRINQFMNKFRKLGYVEYNGRIKVHNSLLNIILEDQAGHAEL